MAFETKLEKKEEDSEDWAFAEELLEDEDEDEEEDNDDEEEGIE